VFKVANIRRKNVAVKKKWICFPKKACMFPKKYTFAAVLIIKTCGHANGCK
jgi:hypothetical protein